MRGASSREILRLTAEQSKVYDVLERMLRSSICNSPIGGALNPVTLARQREADTQELQQEL